MSDRLQELLRQKALLSEHAAWLDREIALERERTAPALETGAAPPPVVPTEPAPAGPVEPTGQPTPASQEPVPATSGSVPAGASTPPIPAEYRTEPKEIRQKVTRGCLTYFVIGLVLLGLGFTAIVLFYRHG